MKIIKRLSICALIICTVIFFGGCTSITQMKEKSDIKKQAKTNAINYISQKYGFEAKVMDVEEELDKSGFWGSASLTGYAIVKLKYEGKEFSVYITGQDESTEGKDDYQYEDIFGTIEKEAKDCLNIEAEKIYFDAACISAVDCMTSIYYDGENLTEIVNDLDGDIYYKIVTYKANLKDYNTENIRTKLRKCADIYIIDCGNESDFENIKQVERNNLFLYYESYAIYMDEYMIVKSFANNNTDFNLFYGDISKYTYDGFAICIEDGKHCDVEEVDFNTKEWVGNGYTEEPKQAFGAYSVETDAKIIYIFVELDELDTKKYKDAEFVWTGYYNGKKKYDNRVINRIVNDKYLATRAFVEEYSNIEFTVFK